MFSRATSSHTNSNAANAAARVTRSINAAREYLECLWNKARAEQNAVVFKLRVEYIERKIKEIEEQDDDDNDEPALSIVDAAEWIAWRENISQLMDSWVSRSEVKICEEDEAVRFATYKKYRDALGLPVYDAPIFIIHPLESEERLAIQRRFDVEREVRIMTNSGDVVSHQEVMNFRAAAGKGRVVYANCPLVTPDLTVQKEIDWLRAAGDVVGSFREWVPVTVARLANTDTLGTPLGEDIWSVYFASMGYKRIEEISAMLAQPQPQVALPASGPAYQHLYQNPYAAQAPPPPPPAAAPHALFSRHGRPQPYQPTRQQIQRNDAGTPTKWNLVRGNTPGNVNVFEYDKLYNSTDCGVGKDDGDKRKRYRESGETRDLTIDKLIARGDLPVGFRDVNP